MRALLVLTIVALLLRTRALNQSQIAPRRMRESKSDSLLNAEWLESDSMGGFASGTVAGYRTRRYHALLLTPRHPPCDRVVLVSGIEAFVQVGGARFPLSTQRYAPDVVQEEFPNRFVPAGARRDLDGLRAAAERGRAVLSGQRFHVRAAYAVGETVILEVLWVGILAIAVGALAAGQEMRAHFAVFLEFRDGKIVRQRNYDCFEPF